MRQPELPGTGVADQTEAIGPDNVARLVGGVAAGGGVVFCQLAPWQFDARKSANLKRKHRRASCLVTRVLANIGVRGSTPVLSRFRKPVTAARQETRWLDGLYLDRPEEWDDPYRFFRW